MSTKNTDRSDDTEQDPRLVEVIAAGNNLTRGKGVLHRKDPDACCGNRPETNTKTDLVTAAVMDGHWLCENCEWPDGAEEVLNTGE